jgi:transposase
VEDRIEAAAPTRTTDRMSSPKGHVQIVERVSGRRIWSLEQKLAIIGEAFSPGSSISQTIERHSINSGQLYSWRKQLLDGELCGPRRALPQFARVDIEPVARPDSVSPLLVSVAAEPAKEIVAPGPEDNESGDGQIEIKLQSGIVIRVDGKIGTAALRRVLDALEGR